MSRIQQAVHDFEQIISGEKKNMMEQIGRSSRGELFVLKFLDNKQTAVTPSEISEAMQTSTARISAALNSLEKKEQIKREIDKNNRRNILVTITESGINRTRTELKKMTERTITILSKMGEEDALEFVRLLGRFTEIADSVFNEEICQ